MKARYRKISFMNELTVTIMNQSNNKTKGADLSETKSVSPRFYAAFAIGALVAISFASAFAGYIFYQKNSALNKEVQALKQESDAIRKELADARAVKQEAASDAENNGDIETSLPDDFSITDRSVVIQFVQWQEREEIPSFNLFSGKLDGAGVDREKVAHYY